MARGFRRKPRVVWLPTDPTFAVDGNMQGGSNVGTFFIDSAGPAAIGFATNADIPLVIDNQLTPVPGTTSLADIESSGYRLRRIVGKVYCALTQVVQDDAGAVLVAVGFIVRRVNPDGTPAFAAARRQPTFQENIPDPWIWRRTWILANGSSSQVETSFVDSANFSNMEGGPSAVDGPHVDAKTARIIGPEERLFMSASVTLLNSSDAAVMSTRFAYDFRVLASMRTSSGNRRNASR